MRRVREFLPPSYKTLGALLPVSVVSKYGGGVARGGALSGGDGQWPAQGRTDRKPTGGG